MVCDRPAGGRADATFTQTADATAGAEANRFRVVRVSPSLANWQTEDIRRLRV